MGHVLGATLGSAGGMGEQKRPMFLYLQDALFTPPTQPGPGPPRVNAAAAGSQLSPRAQIMFGAMSHQLDLLQPAGRERLGR